MDITQRVFVLKHSKCIKTLIQNVSLQVCGADEPTPVGAGHSGRRGLQVCPHRGEKEILLPGGPTEFCHQTAHQLPLQGDALSRTIITVISIFKAHNIVSCWLDSRVLHTVCYCLSNRRVILFYSPRSGNFCPRSCRLGNSPVPSPPSSRNGP